MLKDIVCSHNILKSSVLY